jgi:molybdate transport system substrate-binding protein
MKTVLLSIAFLLSVFSSGVRAQDFTVLTTGTLKGVLSEVIPEFEVKSGLHVTLVNETAGVLSKMVAEGKPFDVVILPPTVLDQFSKDQKIIASSLRPLSKVGIGLATKNARENESLKTVDDFKTILLNANKVAYIDPASGGSSGIFLDKLFKKLGWNDWIQPKAVLVQGGLAATTLTNGQADLAIHQMSELLQVPAIHIVGLLPEEVQSYTFYSVAVGSQSKNLDRSNEFVLKLTSEKTARVIEKLGMKALN